MLRRESSWDSNSSGRAYHIKKKKKKKKSGSAYITALVPYYRHNYKL